MSQASRLSILRAACLALVIGSVAAANATAASITLSSAGFATSVATFTNEGTEDFESSTLAPNSIASFGDPLAPGVLNGPFLTGTTVGLGLTVQSNTLAGMPSTTSPGAGLATASAFFSGTPTDQVSTNLAGASFDMLFGLTDTIAVSFNPLVFDDAATSGDGLFNIRVFDTSNLLIGSQDGITAAAFTNPTTFVGVLAGAGEDIGRINIFGTGSILSGATAGPINYTGADNITIYTPAVVIPPNPVPEPGVLVLFGLGLAAIGYRRTRR